MEALKLIHGDCLEALKTLPDESVDAIITDPPYGTNEEGKNKLNGFTSTGAVVFAHEWDKVLPLDWLKEAVRVLKAGGAVIAWTDTKRTETLWNAFEVAGIRPLQCLFWHKTNPAPNPRKNFASAVEAAVFGRKAGKVLAWKGGGFRHNFFECPKVAGCNKIHETQKPVPLMEWCIEPVVPEGGVILDPFMGSGSTGVAALKGGYKFIGIELNSKHFEGAKKRLLETQALAHLYSGRAQKTS